MGTTWYKKLTYSYTLSLHVLFSLILLMGCASSSITSTAVHQPVMLGDVKKLGNAGNMQEFYVVISTSEWSDRKTSQHIEGAHQADDALQKQISSEKDKLIIEEIYFDYAMVLIPAMCIAFAHETNSIELNGAILKAEQDARPLRTLKEE